MNSFRHTNSAPPVHMGRLACLWLALVLAGHQATLQAAAPVGGVIGADRNVPPLTAAQNGDYRIAPRDLVQFQIYEEPDVQAIQRVSSSGEISVPMLGTVRLGGLTLREAEKVLAKSYVDEGYFVQPQVILSVQTYAARSVSVLGQVNHPQQVGFPVEREQIGIVQAITLAGGFSRVAKTDGVRVFRTVDGREAQFTVNVAGYLDSKGQQEFVLMPDDVVFVPEKVF